MVLQTGRFFPYPLNPRNPWFLQVFWVFPRPHGHGLPQGAVLTEGNSEASARQAKTIKALNFGRTESSFPWLSFVFLVFLIREIHGIRGS